jgi:GT2 family glycosyltransferase
VIVAYHRPEPLARLLDALRDPALELVVVNVDADPAIAQIAAGATVVDLPGNPGFAAGINAGARVASARVVVFMNDDLDAAAATILALADVVDAGADVAIPATVDRDGNIERTILPLPSVGALARDWLLLPDAPVPVLRRLHVPKWRVPDDLERIPAATAAMAAVRAELLRAVPVPEDYFLYWEEAAWFYELARRHKRVVFVRHAPIGHAGWRDDVRPRKSALIARNAVRCIRRTQGRWRAALAYPIVVLWQVRLVLVDGLRTVVGRRDRAVLHARLAGVRAALVSYREVW